MTVGSVTAVTPGTPAAPETGGSAATLPPGRSKRRRRGGSGRRMDGITLAMLLLVIAALTLLIGLPVLNVLSEAFSEDGWAVLERFFTSPVQRGMFVNTVVLGLVTGVIGTAVAFMLAYAQARMRFPGKRIVHLLTLVPIISPPFAVAASTITLFGRSGMITEGFFGLRSDFIYGLPGLTFVLALSYLPLAYLNLLGMIRALDPAHEEAASSLGASRWRVFRTVTLPMLVPGFGGAFLLLFVEAISDLSNPLVLGGDYSVLASSAYNAIIGQYNLPGGAAYALVLMIPAVAVFIIQRYWAQRGSHISVTGKPSGKPPTTTAPAIVLPVLAGVYLFAATVVLLYGTIIVGAFVRILGVNNSFTLDNFEYVLTGNIGSEAMVHTIRMALVATPIAGVLGMLVAWLVVTKLRRGAGLLDFLGMLGIAIPGTVIGIGYLLSYSTPTTVFGVPLLPTLVGGSAAFGGAIAIVMAFCSSSTPSGQRVGIAALKQIDPSLEEASQSLGVSSAGTFRRITLPLIRPAFMAALMYAFASAMTSISAVIFLTTPNARLLTQQIHNMVERGQFGNAFAYCVVLMVIVLIAMLAIHLLTKRMRSVR
ncbi:iron ABC transporter permease [Nesterenkonia sp. MY13]|uniref:Iron ABC transporter permease n=1 Tax=Nesterenkonia sedimenti TaxID=1463632 RepID=A0A7X8TL14_9MICC|nr:iron ABC transporter permease [Nesterenkonia sedimenti]NLS10731.1 iron ABC transporter permease [Nesterenkonia sedimenti]